MAFGTFTAAESDTVTIPSHAIGDTLVIFAGRGDSASTPTIPTGWKVAAGRAFGATTKSFFCCYRLAQSSSETSGTWAGAQFLVCGVYSSTNYVIPIGQSTNANGTANTTVNYPVINIYNALLASGLRMQNAAACVVGCAYAKQISSGIEAAPSGMANLTNHEGAASHHIAVHETPATVANWASTSVVVASAIDWITLMIEMSDTGIAKTVGGVVNGFPISRALNS